MDKVIEQISYNGKPAIKKSWSQQSDLPEYRLQHHFSLNFSSSTLKIPKIYEFGQQQSQYYLITELITGQAPQQFTQINTAYQQLTTNLPRPLRQSQPHERQPWLWLKSQLDQHAQPPVQPDLISARSWLADYGQKFPMAWTHSQFTPEHLVQTNDNQLYLINCRHFSYRPQQFAIAYYWHQQQISFDQYQTQLTEFISSDDQPQISKKQILFSQIGLVLLDIYSQNANSKVEWLDKLLDLSDA